VKYSEYFGAERRESLKNENIRYDIMTKKVLQNGSGRIIKPEKKISPTPFQFHRF